MYILNVTAIQSEEQYLQHREPHRQWVQQQIDTGYFLFSGPKKEGRGGIILVSNTIHVLTGKCLKQRSTFADGPA